MRWPLRLQILLPLAVVMLGALAVVSGLNAWLSTRGTLDRIEGQLRDVARTLAGTNFPLGPVVLQQTRGLSGAEYVVAETTGEVFAASDERLTELPGGAEVQSAASLALERSVEVAGERFFYAAADLDRRAVGGKHLHLHIFYPQQAWREARDRALYPPLAIGGAALLLVVGLSIVVAARVTRPIAQLRRQVDRIAQGDFQPLPLGKRNDEIRDLGESVNRMAEMLARYEDQVRRSERLRTLGQLVGGLAHQLRNAATGCRMALDLHRRQCIESADEENLDVAQRQLALMEEYLQRFLAVGQERRADFRTVRVGDLIAGVLPLVQPLALHLRVRLDFLPIDREMTIEADAESLQQAIINLLLNAIEAAASTAATAGNGDAGNVTVELHYSADDCVELRIGDSGPGPQADIQAQMFEPLVSDKPDGAGLGLAVAREVVERHGGELSWRRHGDMTFFVVELPLQRLEGAHDTHAGD